jgi:hypothetical protein
MTGLEVSGSFKVLIKPLVEPAQVACVVTIRYADFIIALKGERMAYTLPVDHEVVVEVAYVDAKGNPAAVDGNPVWSSSDPAIATVTVDTSNAFKATVTPVGPAGNVQVKVEADADIGAGVTELITLMDVTMVAGQAVAGTLTPSGPPTPIA